MRLLPVSASWKVVTSSRLVGVSPSTSAGLLTPMSLSTCSLARRSDSDIGFGAMTAGAGFGVGVGVGAGAAAGADVEQPATASTAAPRAGRYLFTKTPVDARNPATFGRRANGIRRLR